MILNQRGKKELKTLRRKYDEQNRTDPESIKRDPSGCRETVDSIDARKPVVKGNEKHGRRELLQDSTNINTTTDEPESTDTDGAD